MNSYLRFIIILGLLDFIWLSSTYSTQKSFYESIQQSPLNVNQTAMFLFYLIAPVAFIHFIKPLSKDKSQAFQKGCLMGFLMYMTFDLTNKSLFSNFTWNYAIKDMIWGTFVIGLTSYLTY